MHLFPRMYIYLHFILRIRSQQQQKYAVNYVPYYLHLFLFSLRSTFTRIIEYRKLLHEGRVCEERKQATSVLNILSERISNFSLFKEYLYIKRTFDQDHVLYFYSSRHRITKKNARKSSTKVY